MIRNSVFSFDGLRDRGKVPCSRPVILDRDCDRDRVTDPISVSRTGASDQSFRGWRIQRVHLRGRIFICVLTTDFILNQWNMVILHRRSLTTRFFLYKKHKYKKHRASYPSFSIVNVRNSDVNYRKLDHYRNYRNYRTIETVETIETIETIET